MNCFKEVKMNTRERLERFARERDAYIDACRIQYGYRVRVRVRAMGASNMAGFMSGLFGSTLTMYALSQYNVQPLLTCMRWLHDDASLGDILNLAASFIHGIM
jgi:hypothetical protein